MSVLLLLILGFVLLGGLALGIAVLVVGKGGGGQKDPYRLAVLLVTEIQLYNQELLDRARREKAISRLLGDELGRSRRMYEKRIGPDARGTHFDDAVLRILAQGDPELLGAPSPAERPS
jgi:hypothetical protein